MSCSVSLRRRLRHCGARLCGKLRGIKITRRDLSIFIPSFLALFSNVFAFTMLFPFLPFMIKFLLPKVEEEDIGKYAGFIAASLYLGRFFGCYVWGALADKKGRKPVVIVSCILYGLCSAAFGFSVHIYMAVVFRFFVGLFMGVVGTVKAIISESSTDSTQALGMSLITCAFSLGLIMGPAVSGALADPIGQYNLNISNPVVREFLTKFPFSLPCLVNFLLCVIAVIAVAVWMPETLGSKQPQASGSSRDADSSEPSDHQQLLGAEETSEHTQTTHFESSELELETMATTDSTVGAASTKYVDRESVLVRGSDEKDSGTVSMERRGDRDGEEEGEREGRRGEREGEREGGREGERHGKGGERKEKREGEREGVGDGKREGREAERTGRGYETERRSSLVPFFNRRSSFTPSFFKPLRLSVRKTRNSSNGGGERYTSLHGSRQRLVFDEQEEEEEEEEEGVPSVEEGREEEGVGSRPALLTRLCQSFKNTLQNLKLFLTTRGTLLSLLIYCIFSFATIGFDEVYSLWAAAAPSLGGLGWTLHEIGISHAVSGALFLPFAFTLFPVLERRLGLTAVCQMNAIITLVCMVLLPMAHSIPSDTLNILRWFFVILVMFVIRVATEGVFTATALFINNSVVFGKLGEVNGLAHSLTALLMAIAPVFSGTIFSLSLSSGARNIGFPVNFYLIFIIFGIIIFLCTALGAGLPESINRQKVDSESVKSNSENSSLSIRTDDDTHSGSSNGPETSV